VVVEDDLGTPFRCIDRQCGIAVEDLSRSGDDNLSVTTGDLRSRDDGRNSPGQQPIKTRDRRE
jgi:hypothetical protein